MSTLMKASRQWSSRPADERYSSLTALHAAALHDKESSKEDPRNLRDLRVVPSTDDDLTLVGPAGNPAEFTNWSFSQLCGRASTPTSYMHTLPAKLAAECLNHSIQAIQGQQAEAKLLMRANGGLTLRGMTSQNVYERIWNSQITARLMELEAEGPWQPAPEAFDGSRGLYLGDRNLFAFMVDNNRRIFEKLPGGGVSRGFFCWNSEVGSDSFGVMTFLYQYVCGNHMVWGASNIKEIRIRHVGDATRKAFRSLAVELSEYANGSATEDEAKITRAMQHQLGATKEEVVDQIFKALRIPDLSLKVVKQAADLAETRVDWYGNPRSAFGMGSSITEIARDLPNADDRTRLQRAGSKVIEYAF